MTKVQFGWIIPRSPADDSDASVFIEQITRILSQIQVGFDSAWMTDHFLPEDPKGDSPDDVSLECWTTLCYLANAFPHLNFGSIVLSQSYRNPALFAKMAATLQLWTGGRFILGIGAGWLEAEYEAYGYEFPKASVRIQQLEETVQIIRLMWNDTPASFDGQHYQIQDAFCEPKPDPAPPIMIGGGGEKLTLRVVAKYADWWNLVAIDVDTVAHKQEVLRSHCQSVGRDYNEILQTWAGLAVIAETEAQARQIAEASPYYQAGWNIISGTPDQVVGQLRLYAEIGVEYFMLQFLDFPGPAGATLFASEVIPRFR